MQNIYAVPFGRAFHCNLPGGSISVSLPNRNYFRLNKTIPADPALYPLLISFTPPANKKRELNRINTLLSLPTDAVIRDNKGASVWVQISGYKLKYKMVEMGLESYDRVEINQG